MLVFQFLYENKLGIIIIINMSKCIANKNVLYGLLTY